MPPARRITSKTKIFRLKIALRVVRPPVWRRVLVPGDVRLDELHDIIQVAMGWTDSHLHDFEVGGVRYGLLDPDWGIEVLNESRVKLFRVAAEGTRLRYGYDFGDGWQHDVTVEKVLDPQPETSYPKCVAGRRACPPEDVGGPWGYADFLSALSDPDHPEHETFIEWIGDDFDPAEFDVDEVNDQLWALAWSPAKIAAARPAGQVQ